MIERLSDEIRRFLARQEEVIVMETIELKSYQAAWRRRRAEAEAARREREAKAWSRAGELADLLKTTYGCTAVYLIGSLARGDFGEDSDIDLVVEGLPDKDYFHALGELQRRSEFPVDLIPLVDADRLITESVTSEGIRL
ncbi:MAG: nucleotidyltransferase domain-containing protein [Firmicutes bacterium]|nr:nucleotidyltransferase domain-containing protein [Bacillota bacterium]